MKSTQVNIKTKLPHRAPMLMVDELLMLTNDAVETKLTIHADNIFVPKNHFLEVGLIENMAQTCSIIVGCDFFTEEERLLENGQTVLGFISTIKTIQIHKLPEIGDVILSKGKLISKLEGDGYTLCSMSGEISSQDKMYLNCELSLMIKKIES